ncbi:MAG: FAD-dependent monooxygenase [Hyphomicrobiaceae bacterium]|nr:FAD-dependent monooxygenase [Hyphomicrobiaceae bacterium]
MPNAGTPRRAIIAGGSMGGLYAALCLRRAGWRVDVYERSPVPLVGRGAGIVTHPEMREAMARLGIDAARDFGVPIETRCVLARDGTEIARRPYPQIATSWNRLFAMLRDALGDASYHLGREIVGVEEAEAGVTVRLGDGASAEADLLVAADGFRSVLRGHVCPGAEPSYAGYVAWRGMVEERFAAPALTPALFACFSFVLPPAEQFLAYPVAGAGNDLRPGHRCWNIVWYRPAEGPSGLARLLTDDAGKRHELSIPPPLIGRGVLAEVREATRRLLPPQVQAAMAHLDMPMLQPIYDLAVPRMASRRVALIGDAAFVVRPHVGAGVTKAAEDAAALAEALAREPDVPQALAAFAAARKPMGDLLVARARRLGAHLRHTFASEAEQVAAARNAEPMYAMSETAQLDFLRSEGHAPL